MHHSPLPIAQRLGRLAGAAALILALALPAQLRAQDPAEALRNLDSEIQKARGDMEKARKDGVKADAELRKTDSLLREETARSAASDERAAKDRERREKENAALAARVQETQGRVNQERSGIGRWQNAQDEIKSRQKRLALVLAGYCDSLVRRIEASPPWEREGRLDRVRSLKKDLEAGSASTDEGFARLNAAIKEEIKSGDEIAILNKPVTRKNGDMVNAQVLKVGNQWLVYMDEEGKRFGVLERSAAGTWDWREDPSFEEKNRIKAAIEVKSAKRPPQLAVLDLGIAPSAPVLPAAASPAPAAPSKGAK